MAVPVQTAVRAGQVVAVGARAGGLPVTLDPAEIGRAGPVIRQVGTEGTRRVRSNYLVR
jgi:hypothetical protein